MDRIERSVETYLREFVLPTFAGVLVTGPRGVGKTTSMTTLTRFETKAAAQISAGDARGVRWLRDKLGSTFVAGYVLHTDPLPYRMDDRIWALPLASLWRATPHAAS